VFDCPAQNVGVFQRIRVTRYGNDKSPDRQDALDQGESHASDLGSFAKPYIVASMPRILMMIVVLNIAE
jgi:hypothetical protein